MSPQPIAFTPEVVRVVNELADCNDDFRPYVRTIAADLEMPVEQLRGILRRLGNEGYTVCGVVCDIDDGRPKGSTWWLTEQGIRLREQLRGHGA